MKFTILKSANLDQFEHSFNLICRDFNKNTYSNSYCLTIRQSHNSFSIDCQRIHILILSRMFVYCNIQSGWTNTTEIVFLRTIPSNNIMYDTLS